jgi:hypothetical protein
MVAEVLMHPCARKCLRYDSHTFAHLHAHSIHTCACIWHARVHAQAVRMAAEEGDEIKGRVGTHAIKDEV